jgi:Bacterial aa3 type cytochrome c oxidase subunit IV
MASGNDHKEHNNTYAKVFVPMIKWGTPIFALILLIVVFFTT